MSWSAPRPSYTHLSIHQTLISKALFEHTNSRTVALVAATSSAIRNSSLGPNLLALIPVNHEQLLRLFAQIFVPSEQRITTLQFTQKIYLDGWRLQKFRDELGDFLHSLKQTRYFARTVTSISFIGWSRRLLEELENCVAVENLELGADRTSVTTSDLSVLRTLASLRTLNVTCKLPIILSASFFKKIGDLEVLPLLEGIEMKLPANGNDFDHVAFRTHFCNRLLVAARRRLKTLFLPGDCSAEDCEAVADAGLETLEELGASQHIMRHVGKLPNLVRLRLTGSGRVTSAAFIELGRSSPHLETLWIEHLESDRWAFCDPKTGSPCFSQLRQLRIHGKSVNDDCIDDGFAHLPLLEVLEIAGTEFSGWSLQFLEGKHLKELNFAFCPLDCDCTTHIARFENLEILKFEEGGRISDWQNLLTLKKLKDLSFSYCHVDINDDMLAFLEHAFSQGLETFVWFVASYMSLPIASRLLETGHKLKSATFNRHDATPRILQALQQEFPFVRISGGFDEKKEARRKQERRQRQEE